MRVPSKQFSHGLWIVRIIVYCLKIIGLAPFSSQTTTSTINARYTCIDIFEFSKVGWVHNFLFSILSVAISTLLLQRRFSSHSELSNIVSHMINEIRIITRLCSTCVILIAWTFRQKRAVYILNRLFDVGIQISNLKKKLPNKRTAILLTFNLIIIIAMWIAFWITEITFHPANSVIVIFLKTTTAHVIYWFTMEYVIAVGFIARNLETMNTNLLDFEESRCFLSCSKSIIDVSQAFSFQNQSCHLATLRSLIRIRTELSDLSQDVEDFFAFPLLCCIVTNFCAILRESHIFIVSSNISLRSISLFITWMSINLYPIILLSTNVTKTTQQAKQTALIVRRILTSPVGREIRAELEQFSVQLIHDDFTFTAYGFFTLDLTLLNSIVGATKTYLITSLQF